MRPEYSPPHLPSMFPDFTFPREHDENEEYLNARQELYDSEKNYLTYLSILIEMFVNPLKSDARILNADLRTLFGDINSIFELNKEILHSLREKHDVCEAFEKLVPFLILYRGFAKGYRKAQERYLKLMENRRFRSFIEEQQKDANTAECTLQGLLIMPVQRIPRYILLLQRLMNNSSCDYEKHRLRDLLDHITGIMESIDGEIRECDFLNELLTIQSNIDVPGGIVVPGRRLLHSGTLYQREVDKHGTYRACEFWLFNDILLIGSKKPVLIPQTKRFDMKYRFPLRHCHVMYDEWDGSVQIKCKSEHIIVTAESYRSMKTWNEHLQVAVKRASRLRATLRKESSRLPVKRKNVNLKRVLTERIQHLVPARKQSNTYGASLMFDPSLDYASSSADAPEDLSFSEKLNRFEQQKVQYTARHCNDTTRLWDRCNTRSLPQRALECEKICPNLGDPSNVKMRSDTAPAVLSQPQIKKLSYMEPYTDSIVESSSEEQEEDEVADMENEVPRKARTLPAKSESPPWWVTESQPAEFVRGQSARSRCSLM